MLVRGPIITTDRAATVATSAVLLACATLIACLDPTAAIAWALSTALMTGRH